MYKYKFSIVIAVAPERKAEVFDSLKKVKYPKKKYEIIFERGLNPSENRNRGFEKSGGEIIAFIDDDAVVDSEILKKAEIFFEENKDVDIVGGPQLTPLDDEGFAKISGYALSSIFGAWKITNRYSKKKIIMNADETMLTSANLFCRRKVFEKVKFDPKLFPGEDPDFISKAKREGFKVAYFPEIIVYHRRRPTFRGLIKQIYKYGKVRPKKESLVETLKIPFFLAPSIFLLYLVILIVYTLMNFIITGKIIGVNNTNLSSLLFLPFLVYMLLNIFFSLFNAIRNKDFRAFFILLFVYPAIHISYGTGFLITTIKNIFRK